jgi:hypothetical protein
MSFFKKLFGGNTEKTNSNDEVSHADNPQPEKEVPPANESLDDILKRRFPESTKANKENSPPSENPDVKNAGLNAELLEKVNKMMNSNQPASSKKPEEEFEKEVLESLQRYYFTPGLDIRMNLTGADGALYKYHEALDHTFAEWKNVQSKWDRMHVLFNLWDLSDFKKLEKWQIIQRYNNDRLPVKSLEYQTKNIKEEDFRDVRILVALAKMNRLLSKFSKARSIIDFAYKNMPGNAKVQVEYANILHLSGNEKEKELAHQLINSILEEKIKQSTATTIGLLNFFYFSPGYLDSSVFAASFLSNGEAAIIEWDKMAEEYYYCPVFRYEHAVKLSKTGDSLRALAKLNSLADEFPWYKQGVATTIDIISQLRIQTGKPAFMEEEMKKLKHYLAVNDNMAN